MVRQVRCPVLDVVDLQASAPTTAGYLAAVAAGLQGSALMGVHRAAQMSHGAHIDALGHHRRPKASAMSERALATEMGPTLAISQVSPSSACPRRRAW